MTVTEDYIQELLTYAPHIQQLTGTHFLYNSQQDPHLIPVLSGGGSGHEPAHLGYIGKGMLTGALAGQLFVPPTTEEIVAALTFLDKGKGVFVIVKNFEADLAVFQAAIEHVRTQGHDIRYVVSHDDISVEASFARRHRGVAGTLFLHKIIGQAAQNGASLDELEQLGLALSPTIATLGVAMKAPHCPISQQPLFELREGFISYGVGIHGEAGYKTVPFVSLEKLAIELVNKLRMFFRWKVGDCYAVLINDLGSTPAEQVSLFTQQVLELLEVEGLTIAFVKSGRLMTNLDMTGLSVSMCHLTEKHWVELLNSDTNAPAWK
ncbi:DhaKLM operon coactivator DhaQ [Streptococcus caprae]|uniref:DhaKLM operon coactivator DhaQ n=1 Tax=Streptococcus caprae TaxID=1640501 RepID=A0ABV8CTH5_9STRE